METVQDVKIDPLEFRHALGRFATGITVITTEVEAQVYGMTANAFMSVSLDPPLVLISVDNRARMNSHLLTSRRYGVSILAEPHELFSRHFAGRPIEGLKIPFVKKLNMTVLDNALACLIADVVEVYPAGDHTLYVGHVQYLEWQEEKPLLFFAGKYGQLHLEPGASAALPDDDPFFFHSHGGYPALPYSF